MDDEDYKITSEIFEEHDYHSSSKPMISKKNVVSKFQFKYPQALVEAESNGDVTPSCKKPRNEKTGTVEIEHRKSTVLSLVGLQIWRGALLLADWLLHNAQTFKKDHYILELGSGVGLSSIVAGMISPVFCTDVNKGGLVRLIKGNILRNAHLYKHPIKVLELDFTLQVLPNEIVAALDKIPVVVAADVVYDDEITVAFVKTVGHLLAKPPQRSVYVALEKRFVFTIEDCDVVAPCYEYFLECLKELDDVVTEQVPLDFLQYFRYERVNELVLWKISNKFEEKT